MDIFKQNRYLTLVVVLLVIFNFATLAMLWLDRPSHQKPPSGQPIKPEQDQARIETLLSEELAFDEQQIEEYLLLRREHQNQIRRLNDQIQRFKKQMFDEAFQNNPRQELVDSLLMLAQDNQAQIEMLTFQHFLNLKDLCKADQRDKLQLLMHEILHRRPSGDKARPRPPRPGDRRQPPPRRN